MHLKVKNNDKSEDIWKLNKLALPISSIVVFWGNVYSASIVPLLFLLSAFILAKATKQVFFSSSQVFLASKFISQPQWRTPAFRRHVNEKHDEVFLMKTTNYATKLPSPDRTPKAGESNVNVSDEWEVDCYSRPVMVDKKKLWELLITDSNGAFRHVETIPANKVNSREVLFSQHLFLKL